MLGSRKADARVRVVCFIYFAMLSDFFITVGENIYEYFQSYCALDHGNIHASHGVVYFQADEKALRNSSLFTRVKPPLCEGVNKKSSWLALPLPSQCRGAIVQL